MTMATTGETATLPYPGQPRLAEATTLVGQLARLGHGASEYEELAVRCLSTTCQAAARGLSLSDRLRALSLWSDAVELLLKEGGVPHQPAATLLGWLQDAGLTEVFLLMDAQQLERACALIDQMCAFVLLGQEDDAAACRFADDWIGRLPLVPQRTLAARVLRGDPAQEAAQIYRLGQRLREEASDAAWIALGTAVTLLDPMVRGHAREQMSHDNLVRLRQMEDIDAELTTEFGAELYVQGHRSGAGAVAGSIVRAFSKEAQAQNEVLERMRAEWQGRISGAAGLFGKDPYIASFATYLTARVDAAMGHVAAAIKGYREALEKGFDPCCSLSQLAFILCFRKKPDEARALLEEWLPRLSAGRSEEAPFPPVAGLLEHYSKAGGRPQDLRDGATLEEVRHTAARNQAQRLQRATEIAAKAQGRRAEILDGYAQEGLRIVGGMLPPACYDAALSGAAAAASAVRLDPGDAARLCLDETPLFQEAGLDQLAALVRAGLAEAALGAYGLRLAECAERRYRLGWQQLAERMPGLFRSAGYADRRLAATLERGDAVEARGLLLHFAECKVLSEAPLLAHYATLADRYDHAGRQDETAALGEKLHLYLTGEAQVTVKQRTAATLVALARVCQSPGGRVNLLDRAHALAPENAEIRDRLAVARRARLKRNLILTGVGAAVLVAAAGGIALLDRDAAKAPSQPLLAAAPDIASQTGADGFWRQVEISMKVAPDGKPSRRSARRALTDKQVSAVMQGNHSLLRHCVEREMRSMPAGAPAPVLLLELLVDESGSVSSIKLNGSSDSPGVSCLREQMRPISFPRVRGKTQVTFSYTVRPDQPRPSGP